MTKGGKRRKHIDVPLVLRSGLKRLDSPEPFAPGQPRKEAKATRAYAIDLICFALGLIGQKSLQMRKAKAKRSQAKVATEFLNAMIENLVIKSRGSAEAPKHPSKEARAAKKDVNEGLIAIGLDPVSEHVIEKILRPKGPLRITDVLYEPPSSAPLQERNQTSFQASKNIRLRDHASNVVRMNRRRTHIVQISASRRKLAFIPAPQGVSHPTRFRSRSRQAFPDGGYRAKTQAITMIGGNPVETLPVIMQYLEDQREAGGPSSPSIRVGPKRQSSPRFICSSLPEPTAHWQTGSSTSRFSMGSSIATSSVAEATGPTGSSA